MVPGYQVISDLRILIIIRSIFHFNTEKRQANRRSVHSASDGVVGANRSTGVNAVVLPNEKTFTLVSQREILAEFALTLCLRISDTVFACVSAGYSATCRLLMIGLDTLYIWPVTGKDALTGVF